MEGEEEEETERVKKEGRCISEYHQIWGDNSTFFKD